MNRLEVHFQEVFADADTQEQVFQSISLKDFGKDAIRPVVFYEEVDVSVGQGTDLKINKDLPCLCNVKEMLLVAYKAGLRNAEFVVKTRQAWMDSEDVIEDEHIIERVQWY